MPRLILVGGGCRSGKSRFALRRARELAPDPARRVFLATGQAFEFSDVESLLEGLARDLAASVDRNDA